MVVFTGTLRSKCKPDYNFSRSIARECVPYAFLFQIIGIVDNRRQYIVWVFNVRDVRMVYQDRDGV